MDTSEEYIKMCEKAGEIQKVKPSPNDPREFFRLDKNAVWLPRQDQLQEMCQEKKPQWLLSSLDISVNHEMSRHYDYFQRFTSMEQLWLAFVMKERFNKTWSEKEWK